MKRLQFVRWAINFSWLMRWAEFKNCIENIDANECVCVCTSARILHMCVSLHNKNDALRTWLNIARAHREHRLLIHLANDVCVCVCAVCMFWKFAALRYVYRTFFMTIDMFLIPIYFDLILLLLSLSFCSFKRIFCGRDNAKSSTNVNFDFDESFGINLSFRVVVWFVIFV